jgi:hypothetical protein
MHGTSRIIERNRHWMSAIPWNMGIIVKALNLQANVNVETNIFINAVKAFQKSKGLSDDGIIGPASYAEIVKSLGFSDDPFTKIIAATVAKESGGKYDAMNLDGEFRGRFDASWQRQHGRPHPASGKIHIGLSFGIIQFTQDGGSLGQLLRAFAKKNEEKFKRIVGSTWHELLNVTSATGPSGLASGARRSSRVQKVRVSVGQGEIDFRDIWEEPWVGIFKRLGNDPEFNQVQDFLALELYLNPIAKFLKESGLTSELSVAMGFDLSVHRGVGGARNYIRSRIAPKDERATLNRLSADNRRSKLILDSSGLSFMEWEGWKKIKI